MDRRTALRWLGAAATAIAAADLVALLRWPTDSPALTVEPAPSPELDFPEEPRRTDARPPERPRRPRGRRAEPSDPDETAASGSGATPAASTLAVVCRREWGARPPAGPYGRHRLVRTTVHHTAVVATDGDAAARVRSHQQHHLESGFSDLAYHFVVARDGRVFEGRPVTAPGETFTDYDPTGHFLPCLEGNFDEQVPTPAQVQSLVALLAWAAGRWGLEPAAAAGHRAFAATSCPGDAVQALLDSGSVQVSAQRLVAAGGVRLVDSCA